ncbi:NUDIX domain-containing protein [Lentzea sp. NEAU-D13]|uniref:NUDIX domain-containing protein n=1 Tax=Lentzea alba TaxID=2714351 RepID=A0A7C9VYT9_9PSEU|nr:NUDIX domain-containing protein [Lentzea alba]NGY61197.1 NUDIX domain-containing protein [Lentzea alba]
MIDKVAWVHVVDGRVLVARSHGKDTFYVPGGKREPGESDVETLVREIREELSVDVSGPELIGVFEAQAHGRAEGETVRMTCYTATFAGELKPASEIAELAWFTTADADRVSPVTRVIFSHLESSGLLA